VLAKRAQEVADKTFSTSSPLPFSDAPETPSALQGRRRLAGAFLIDIDRIEPDPDQPRVTHDPVAHAELTLSVKRLGILQPITVRYLEALDRYRIIAGERRYRAAKAAGFKDLPCWVQDPDEEEVLLRQIVENWQRADLQPFDLADSLVRLKDSNDYSQKDLAVETGKSEGEISKLLSILTLAPDVQKLAREDTTGAITKQHLYSLVKLSPQTQHATIHAVLSHRLTVDATERMIADEKRKAKKARHGAPVTRLRFRTASATVLIVFRKKHVDHNDIVAVLNDVKRQHAKESSPPDAR
jgi:ParB family chromosome partitioning protein